MSESSSLFRVPSKRLAVLLSPATVTEWSPRDIAAIHNHFMTSPVELDITPPHSLRHLLLDSQTPVEQLLQIKNFAQAWRERDDCSLPPQVSSAVYWLAVAAARVCSGQTITSFPLPDILSGLRWASTLPWLHPTESRLLADAIRSFELDPGVPHAQ